MSGLDDLFNSPVKAPPRRSPSRSRSPVSPIGNPAVTSNNPLFFSPGAQSEFGSPSNSRINRERDRSISPSITSRGIPLDQPQSQLPNGIQSNLSNGSNSIQRAPDPVYTTHQLGDFEDPFAALNNSNNANQDDDEQEGMRKRRKMAKVDADRLTSDRGIPALCRAAKKFKAKGKGYETQDLTNLLNVYQMWAHGMFPKGDFQHTINRVEVICRSKRMESAIKGYREAFYPRPRTPSPPPLSDRGLTPPTASQQEEGEQELASLQRKEPLFTSRPPVNDDDDDMGPDLEEMMAIEEEMQREAQGSITTVDTSRQTIVDDGPPVLEEEDELEGLYD
ncbi:uncharacterized protein L201_001861 [Kwoniella dendrophila CBS 6074]|uniref:Chromosome segregation in meiosis protein n=1 Tax=Kwoniella dendrophila CBS 6074 TaxID=1295534 RepID=A0AAX4JNI5_9TREE